MAANSEKEPPPTPRSKLETLPREDLIRFAKKQALASKQLREKNEELEAKLKERSSASTRETAESTVQTEPTEENHEESQWLRMALTAKEPVQMHDRSQTSENQETVPKTDSFAQTSPVSEMANAECYTEIHTSTAECQTDEDHGHQVKVVPQAQTDPDALREAKTQLQLLAAELEEARRELASQSLWKLEMDDTEKSFAKLQSELRQSASLLTSAQNENASLSSEIQTLQKRLTNSEADREKAEKKAADSEAMLEAVRRESNLNKLELNETEIKLATAVEELERMKLDTASDASSTQRRLYDLQIALDESRRRLEKSESDRVLVEKQLDELNNEYRAYRTRVHSVLKHERTTNASATDGEDSSLNERRAADQQLMNSLREQLEKAKQLYEACRCDLDRVREQHDQLYERHRMLRTHADESEAQWKCELEQLRSDAARVARLHAEQVRTLTQDKRDLQRDFDRKMEEMLADKKDKVTILEQRVSELERDLMWSKQQLSEYDRKGSRSEKTDSEAKDDSMGRRRGNVELSDFAVSPRPLMERKPGEGAENADVVKKPSLAVSIGTSDFQLPFERQRSLEDLLGDQQSIHSFDTGFDRPTKDENATMVAKLRHLTELLSESEANNSRLSEQIKLLKDEIRRLERNNERSEHIANAEYLKNIVMQFLNPSMQDRRQRLLPVLTTLLRLSPEEVATLKDASPDAQAPAVNATSAGWSGYLHRWSGLN